MADAISDFAPVIRRGAMLHNMADQRVGSSHGQRKSSIPVFNFPSLRNQLVPHYFKMNVTEPFPNLFEGYTFFNQFLFK